MPRTTKLYSTHPLFAYSMCVLIIIGLTSMVMSGCSDSNLPNYVSGDDFGVASGIISHGDYRIDAVSGFVSFVNTVTGNAEVASISNISVSTSVYSLELPQGNYKIVIGEGAVAFTPSATEFTSGTVTLDPPADNIAIFGSIPSLVSVIGVTYNPGE